MASLYFSTAEISNFDSTNRLANDSTGSFFSDEFWVLSISTSSLQENRIIDVLKRMKRI
jgi:hypothetical protein